MNMDYVLCQSLQRLGGIPLVIVLYDVMCQYWKNLKNRVDQSPYLHLDPDLVMHKGIGLFHVHGHKDECMPMFAPTYIPGAGNVDGEILETLWAPIEKVSGSTRAMTTSHRQETLDDHMNDSNWKTLVGMGHYICLFWPAGPLANYAAVRSLCKKYPAAKDHEKLSTAAFTELNEGTDRTLARTWSLQAKVAQRDRFARPAAMLIYEVQMEKGQPELQWVCFVLNDSPMSSADQGTDPVKHDR